MAHHLLADWASLVDEARLDRLGNYIGLKRGRTGGSRPPRVLAAAHMDSIGGMVTSIEAGGFLRFTTVGGVDRRLLMAQEVEVHGARVLPGLVGSKPPHVTAAAERSKLVAVEQLFIDTGLPEAEVRALVSPGAPVLPRMEMRHLQNGRISSRYMDNRASLVALKVALQELQRVEHGADFYAVGTVGEEFGGLPGATVSAFTIAPEIAIAVDVTFGMGPDGDEETFPLGQGPTIGVGPNCTPRLAQLMREVAAELGINYALEVLPGPSGTDAWAMHLVRGGAASGVLSIPLRYMHTPVELVDLADITAAGRLLAHLVARVNTALVEELSCFWKD